MKPRELVVNQLEHYETHPVPYSLGFEGDVAAQLDAHYGAPDWRARLVPYMATVGYIDTVGETRVDEAHVRDAFGSLWRDDRRPWHLVEPALHMPNLDDLAFPSIDHFIGNAEKLKADALRACAEKADSFQIISIG